MVYNQQCMALSIKNDETERLARQVAGETGESLTEAIQKALQERWERLKSKRRSHVLANQVEDLLRRVDALPTLDSRPADEILGYDEHGMPRSW
jgi:antitoxin VapB